MKALRLSPRRQLEQFLSALFRPDEWVELRFIESWQRAGKKHCRVARAAEWMRPATLLARHGEITRFAKRDRSNVYFGVCPREKPGDSQDDQIRTVRCLWCDIDDVTVDEAFARWDKADVPAPSILVTSGGGIHGYWLLDHDVRSSRGRKLISDLLPYFYRSFGGDHVQNLSRILRPPGTLNFKDARNGRRPRPCTLLACEPDRRYPLQAFQLWMDAARTEQQQRRRAERMPSTSSTARFPSDNPEVVEIVRNLDRPARDRSRRDFAVVCDLLRLGLAAEEIWLLVADSSKFESNGRAYFDVTVANAQRCVLLESSPQTEASA
jgi:hypothetical protein